MTEPRPERMRCLSVAVCKVRFDGHPVSNCSFLRPVDNLTQMALQKVPVEVECSGLLRREAMAFSKNALWTGGCGPASQISQHCVQGKVQLGPM